MNPTSAEVVRYGLEFMCWIIVIRFAHLLPIYWRIRHFPNQELGQLTLRYHIGVAYLIAVIALAVLLALHANRPLTAATVLLLPGMVFMFWVVNGLHTEYQKIKDDHEGRAS